MIVPQKNSRVIRFKLSAFVLKLLLLSLAAATFGSAYILVDYMIKREADKAQRHLQKKIMIQKFKFREIDNILDSDRKELENLKRFERKLRLISGFKDVSSNIRFIGSGTNGLLTTNHGQWKQASILDDLKNLDLELKLREISFFQLEAYLQEQKDRLARTPSISPMKGYISSRFGIRTDPLTGRKKQHYGLDITNRMFTPIYAPADGVVTGTLTEPTYGLLLVIDHGYDTVTRYGHISKFEVKVGQYVKRGDLICRMGNEGRSSGPHLHYEVLKKDRYVDPLRYILD